MSDDALPIGIECEANEQGPEKVGAGILLTWVSSRRAMGVCPMSKTPNFVNVFTMQSFDGI